MCVFNFEDGMAAESWYAWLAFRRRVSMSAIGSGIVMSGGASLAAVPRALGRGDSAPGLSANGGAVVTGARAPAGGDLLERPGCRPLRGPVPGPALSLRRVGRTGSSYFTRRTCAR